MPWWAWLILGFALLGGEMLGHRPLLERRFQRQYHVDRHVHGFAPRVGVVGQHAFADPAMLGRVDFAAGGMDQCGDRGFQAAIFARQERVYPASVGHWFQSLCISARPERVAPIPSAGRVLFCNIYLAVT